MNQLETRPLIGDTLVLTSMALFGLFPVFLRFYPEISHLTFLFAFQVVGATAFFVTNIHNKFPRLYIKDILLITALAVVAVSNDLLYFLAYRTTTVANAAIAHQSVSIFLLLLAPWFLKEQTQRNEWITLALSLGGLIILYQEGIRLGANDLWGISYATLSGFFYACLMILYRVIPDAGRGLNIRVVNLCRFLISTAMLLPLMHTDEIAANIFPLITFGVIFGGIATGLHTLGINKSRSLRASILGRTEPIFAILYGLLIFSELPTFNGIVGGTLILGSSIWLSCRKNIS